MLKYYFYIHLTLKEESRDTQQNLGDMMLGDQPPEERLGTANEIELDKGKYTNVLGFWVFGIIICFS